MMNLFGTIFTVTGSADLFDTGATGNVFDLARKRRRFFFPIN